MNHLSFSSLKQFAACPKGWFNQRILNAPQISGTAADFGRRFEDRLVKLMGLENEPKQHGYQPKQEVAAKQEIPEALQSVAGIEAAQDALEDEIRLTTALYFKSGGWVPKNMGGPEKFKAQKEIWIEPNQWGYLADDLGAHSDIHLPILGYIDLLHTDGVKRTVCDLKTSTIAGNRVEFWLQVLLYSLIERAQQAEIHLVIRPKPEQIERWNDERRREAAGENLGKSKMRKKPEHRTAFYMIRPTPEMFRYMMTWVSIQADGIRRAAESSLEKQPAYPNFGCAWCGLSGACEANLLTGIKPFGGTETASTEMEG